MATPTSYRKDWWREEQRNLHEAIRSVTLALEQNNQTRMLEWIRNFRMYGDFNAAGLRASNYFRPHGSSTARMSYNVVKSCADTITARIAKNRPQPRFLTEGGTWSSWKRARLLNKTIQGLFYLVGAYQKSADAFRASTIFGTAAVKLFDRDDQPVAEQVGIDELLIDDMDAVYGCPRQLHQKRAVDRGQLIAAFPDLRKKLEDTPAVKPEASHDGQADMVWVTESWHLPARKIKRGELSDAEVMKLGGVHAITVENATLLVESWWKWWFPFAFMRWGRPLKGFHGSALASELTAVQVAINRASRQVNESSQWAVPMLKKHKATTMTRVTADAGLIWEWEGPEEPKIETQRTIPQEVLAYIQSMKADAYGVTGISELSAQSKKPAGLESGAALREFNDIESERFSLAGVEFENFHLEMARQLIEVAKDIDASLRERGKDGFRVSVPRRRATQVIKWADVDLEEDAYVMQLFPTSSLPSTPAGKLETLLDMNELGLIPDKNEMRRLLNWPDLESLNALADADGELVEWQIEQIIEKERAVVPDPHQDLAHAVRTMTAAYLMALPMSDVSDVSKDLMREYIDIAAALSAKASPPPQIGPQAPPAGTPPAPGPQPVGATPPAPLPTAPPPAPMMQ